MKTDEVSVFPVRNKSFDKRRGRLRFIFVFVERFF
nr:MAG TPA: hypothetical protein [Microviridae sp.]